MPINSLARSHIRWNTCSTWRCWRCMRILWMGKSLKNCNLQGLVLWLVVFFPLERLKTSQYLGVLWCVLEQCILCWENQIYLVKIWKALWVRKKTDQANREPRHRQSKLQDSGCSLHGFSNFLHPLQGESSGKRCKVVFFSDPACRSCPVFVIFLVPVCHFWPWSVRTRTEMYTCNIYIYTFIDKHYTKLH